MRATLLFVLGAAAGLTAACHRSNIYSKQSSPAPQAMAATADGAPPFVGRWAATRADCASAAWTLTPRDLAAPGGTHCSFVKLSAGSAGYGADVSCAGVGPGQVGRLTLTLSGQGVSRGLTVAGGPFAMPVGLAPCPAAPEPAPAA